MLFNHFELELCSMDTKDANGDIALSDRLGMFVLKRRDEEEVLQRRKERREREWQHIMGPRKPPRFGKSAVDYRSPILPVPAPK